MGNNKSILARDIFGTHDSAYGLDIFWYLLPIFDAHSIRLDAQQNWTFERISIVYRSHPRATAAIIIINNERRNQLSMATSWLHFQIGLAIYFGLVCFAVGFHIVCSLYHVKFSVDFISIASVVCASVRYTKYTARPDVDMFGESVRYVAVDLHVCARVRVWVHDESV